MVSTKGNELNESKNGLNSARKSTASGIDNKFIINHNNTVEPNFHSQSYKVEARASYKKRMDYNPMEAAKKQ